MTQIEEVLRRAADAVERDEETERRAIDRAQRALSAAIVAAAQEPPAARHRRGAPSRGLVTAKRRPSRRVVLAGGIAAAGFAFTCVFGFQGSSFTPSPAVAATMDRLARIATAEGWGAIPGPGQYLYTKSEGVALTGAGTHDLDQRQEWFSSGGDMLVSDPRDSGTSPDSEVEAIGGPSSYFPTTVSGWQSLSTDPATLLRQLRRLDAPNAPDTSAEEFTVIGDALRETPIPPATRVVIYRAAALIPGVRLLGPQTDPAGQAGVGVGYYTSGTLQSELIFDEQTARLIGELSYDREGHVTYAWCYLEQKIVDSAPSAGSKPPATSFPRFQLANPLAGSATTQRTTTTP